MIMEIADIAIALALLSGAFFTLVGSIGLLKLNTPMKRVHAPTKAGTLGVGSFLLASMIDGFWLRSALSTDTQEGFSAAETLCKRFALNALESALN